MNKKEEELQKKSNVGFTRDDSYRFNKTLRKLDKEIDSNKKKNMQNKRGQSAKNPSSLLRSRTIGLTSTSCEVSVDDRCRTDNIVHFRRVWVDLGASLMSLDAPTILPMRGIYSALAKPRLRVFLLLESENLSGLPVYWSAFVSSPW
ncbi:hypothetical protein HAX54_015809 [Datura stramonium]|uniref:Uncharacterized protein n=1 Tax=Datura stramonium TaxID=4076 RepID=A0ABS8UJ16_DATST|nr:hypothetical protein [Datura stramonium]